MAHLPILTFLTDRVKEQNPTFELRKGTAYEKLFFQPLQMMVQPLRDEADDIFIGQSLLRILLTDNPDEYDEEAVDALLSNIYVTRRQGGYSSGVGYVYFNSPVAREYAAGSAVFTGSNSKQYSNPLPFVITAAEMEIQLEEGLYYMAIPVVSNDIGTDTELAPGELVGFQNDPDVVTVTNKVAISGGLDKETNTDLINRGQKSIGVRDLVADKGFRATFFDNFGDNISEVQPIGAGDPEMMRDVMFNMHTLGKVDGFIKTAKVTQKTQDFMGLLVDITRQAKTSFNLLMNGTAWTSSGVNNIDRSTGINPLVREIKISRPAEYVSPVDLSAPINLAVKQYVKIIIDGVSRDIRIAGATPSQTTRNEIINLINISFGQTVAYRSGASIKVVSPKTGLSSQIIFDNPAVGQSALLEVFGLSTIGVPYTFFGDGPVIYIEGTHFEVNDVDGLFRRVIGPIIVPTQASGTVLSGENTISDIQSNIFLNVETRDIVTISSGTAQGDYRVISKTNNNVLVLDREFTASETVIYTITRTGIKSGEVVYSEVSYNPLSIDIGAQIQLDQYGRVRGIRDGREDQTITDACVLRIVQIEEIDPLTREPTGFILSSAGGYGRGQYGKGGYGVGTGSDFRMVVNKPELRFSVFDDSFIVLKTGLEGLSFRVTYQCVPEMITYHDFARSGSERTLNGDILMKHFIPCFVSGEIKYSITTVTSTTITNEALLTEVKKFIETVPAGTDLEISDITQYIQSLLDPYKRFNTYIAPYELKAYIHNTDGVVQIISSDAKLSIPTNTPIFTTRPLSPRISHWIAGDIVLTRN